MSKVIVGIGGGEIKGWSFETKDNNQLLYQTAKIDEEIVKLSNTQKPKLLFIGTASRENPIYFEAIRNIYENLNCEIEPLEILNKEWEFEELKAKVLSYDIIYIGGGNTKFMFTEWENVRLGNILLEAYNKGIVMAGFSAGCYCYHKYNYELIEGLGIISAISSVHYEEKSEKKREEFYNAIKEKNLPGIALENGTAIKYLENNTYTIIKSIESAKAYKIEYIDDTFKVQQLNENTTYSF